MVTKVYSPNAPETPLQPHQIANWANKVHRQAGGKGSPYSKWDYYEDLASESRLGGHHCSCGVNERGFSKGQFDLLPLDDEAVVTGGKAYMKCRVCGEFSHL